MDSDMWWRRLVEVGIDLTVATGVLYLFGRSMTDATFWTLGIHPSLVQLSVTEYVLRGINIAVPLLAVTVFLVLICFVLHRRYVVPALAAPPYERRRKVVQRLFEATALAGAAILALAGLVALAQDTISGSLGIWLPLSVTLGAAAVLYSYSTMNSSGMWRGYGHWPKRAMVVLVLTCAVWTGIEYGEQIGEQTARNFADNLEQQPEVVVFSESRLAIAGRGVQVRPIGQKDDKYRFCYRGLRLLTRSNDQYIFIPVGWYWGDEALSVIPANDSLRVDMRYGGAVGTLTSC